MKKLTFALLGLMMFAACQKKEATIHITVKDKTLDSVSVYLANADTVLALDAEGKTSVTLPVTEAQYGMLQYKWKQSPVYMEPGKDFSVTWDMTPSELTIAFEGENADKNNFINSKEMKGPVMGDFGRPEEELLGQLEEYQTNDFKILESKGFDKAFVEKEKKRVEYWIYGMLWQYATNKACSDATYEKLESLISEDEWLTQLSEYTNYMSGAISVLANQGKDYSQISASERAENNMEYVINHIKAPKIKEYLLGVYAISYVTDKGVNNAEKIKTLLEENVTDKEILDTFHAAYSNGATLAKGCPSPDFKMTSIDGKEYTLADFKGKIVYIDIWATWCAPCQEELPHLKALEEMFVGSNLCFVSMSIDKDKDRWEKQVKDDKLGGIQLYAGPESQFCTDYHVKGIPHFILIDKEGKIIEANMTRPSDVKTIKMLGMMAEPLE